MNRALAFVCAAALLTGCHKQKAASPQFAQASAQFNHLYAEELEDAYLDPQMEAIEAQLRQVPADSLDHDAAQALLSRIAKGREQARRDQERLAKEQREALAPPTFAPSSETPGEPAGRAAPAAVGRPEVGMPRNEFAAKFSNCFNSMGPVQVADAGTAEVFSLSTSADCQKQFSWYADRLVVVDQEKVIGFGLKSQFRAAPPPSDAGVAPAAGQP